MGARILDGRRIAATVRADLAPLARAFRERHGRPATLAILRAGDDAASDLYTKSLLRNAEAIAMDVRVVTLSADVDDAGLCAAIQALNGDPQIQGILVQAPLPPHLAQRTVAEAIDPAKDVDGISTVNIGNLFLRQPSFVPSTCAAVVELLERSRIALAGARVVVVGASNVVGKPLAFMLLHRDATVSVCHIYTCDLPSWTRQADVLVVAVGKPGLITAQMVKPGATVVDVGINPRSDGGVVGDVDYAAVARVAGAITPVPGGVGPLTNLMLLRQTLLAAGAIGREYPLLP
jgi:methylenetetrahydrofolate dehydrogenase (NADP+)/methenyltetrahydrofolate cyclohydrolase